MSDDDKSLRSNVIRLAASSPREVREALLPLLRTAIPSAHARIDDLVATADEHLSELRAILDALSEFAAENDQPSVAKAAREFVDVLDKAEKKFEADLYK